MSSPFDAYHKWLGIPPAEQPPNHYRLLAIPLFETDHDVIEAAADQRMTHLRAYQNGPRSQLSQRLLNEISAARVCLLSPPKKEAYDTTLRALLGQASAANVTGPPIQLPSVGPPAPPSGLPTPPPLAPARETSPAANPLRFLASVKTPAVQAARRTESAEVQATPAIILAPLAAPPAPRESARAGNVFRRYWPIWLATSCLGVALLAVVAFNRLSGGQAEPGKPVKNEPLAVTPPPRTAAEAIAALTALGATFDPPQPTAENSPLAIGLPMSKNLRDNDLKHLAALPNLQRLDLSYTLIGDNALAYLEPLKELRELKLVGAMNITAEGLRKHLVSLAALETLDVHGTEIRVAGLGELLAALPKLTVIDSDGVNRAAVAVTRERAFAELQQIAGNESWHTGDMGKLVAVTIRLDDDQMQWLAAFPELERANLSGGAIHGHGLRHLKGLANLRALLLNSCPLADDELAPLGELVQLTDLRLWRAKIGDAASIRLKTLSGLKVLHLEATQITDHGLVDLRRLGQLEELNLNGDAITDAGLEQLAALTNLKRLFLNDTKVSTEGLAHLAGLVQLRSLWLSRTQVDDGGLKYLGGWPELSRIHLIKTHFTQAGLATLHSTLPKALIVGDLIDAQGRFAVAANVAQRVDLLAAIDPDRPPTADRPVRGKWTKTAAGLQSPPLDRPAWYPIAPAPALEYDLTAVVERVQGTDSFNLLLPIGGHSVVAVVDADAGKTTRLDLVDGEKYSEGIGATAGANLLALGTPHTLICRVRRDGVRLLCDGALVMSWIGDPTVCTPGGVWNVADRKLIHIGSWSTSFLVKQLAVCPVGQAGNVAGLSQPGTAPRADAAAVRPSKLVADRAKVTALKKEILATFAGQQDRALYNSLIVSCKTEADATKRLALLELALDAAEAAGAIDESFGVIAEMDAFELPEGSTANLRVQAIKTMIDSADVGERRRLFMKHGRPVVDKLADDGHYDQAETIAKYALNLNYLSAKEQKDLQSRIPQFHRLAVRIKAAPIQQALETLKLHPDDSDANAALGEFFALDAENLRKGLPLLAKSSSRLRGIAESLISADARGEQLLKSIDDCKKVYQSDSGPAGRFARRAALTFAEMAQNQGESIPKGLNLAKVKEVLNDPRNRALKPIDKEERTSGDPAKPAGAPTVAGPPA